MFFVGQVNDHVKKALLAVLILIFKPLLSAVVHVFLQTGFFQDHVEHVFRPIAQHLGLAPQRLGQVCGFRSDAGDLVFKQDVLIGRFSMRAFKFGLEGAQIGF